MRLCLTLLVLFLCATIAVDGFAQQATGRYALYADFDNKAVGDPIGTRGAMFGEPYTLDNLNTKIVQPTAGISVLRVSNDLSSSNARSLGWQLLGDAEIETGEVEISFVILPSALDRYSMAVRESGGSSRMFLSLTLTSTGGLNARDENGTIFDLYNVYTAGQKQSFKLLFDMDTRTSSIVLNGQVLASNRAFGVSDRGIGRLLIGYASSSNGSSFYLDNLRVVGTLPFPPVLQADFEDKAVGAPIGTGGAEANEPYTVDGHIDATVIEPTLGNRILDISSNNSSAARALNWQFLKDLEVRSGLLVMDFDLTLQSLDFYAIYVREPGTSSKSFMNLFFVSNGHMSVSDQAQPADYTLPGVTYNAGQTYEYRIIFDADSGNYDIFRDGAPIVRERNHGISTRGIGAILYSFTHKSHTSKHMQLDNLRVMASDAAFLPAELEFLTEATTAEVNQTVTPIITVGAINVMNDPVTDGTPVSLEIAPGTGPAGASLDGNNATTKSGVAGFPALSFDTPGTYRLRARSLGKTQIGTVDVVVSPSDAIFADGFDFDPI